MRTHTHNKTCVCVCILDIRAAWIYCVQGGREEESFGHEQINIYIAHHKFSQVFKRIKFNGWPINAGICTNWWRACIAIWAYRMACYNILIGAVYRKQTILCDQILAFGGNTPFNMMQILFVQNNLGTVWKCIDSVAHFCSCDAIEMDTACSNFMEFRYSSDFSCFKIIAINRICSTTINSCRFFPFWLWMFLSDHHSALHILDLRAHSMFQNFFKI